MLYFCINSLNCINGREYRQLNETILMNAHGWTSNKLVYMICKYIPLGIMCRSQTAVHY